MKNCISTSLFSALFFFAASAHAQDVAAPQTAKQSTATYRVTESRSESGPHYARARELYELGPSKGAEIIAELDLELRDYPNSAMALLLKARTQMGIDQLDAALATLDQLSAINSKTETISPNAVLLRARILFYKGEFETAKRTLEPFWAFFQSDEKGKSRYASLMTDIDGKLKKPGDK